MNIITRTLLPVIGLFFIFMLLIVVLLAQTPIQMLISLLLVFGLLMAVCTYIYVFLLKPIQKLHTALEIINFEDDIIDFSKVDGLEVTGFPEIKSITIKFKYLLDIIAERITKFNNEAYRSEHDELTGLLNRTHLAKVKTRYETQRNVFVIFFDLNNLKKMNDIFGHEAGDALLRNTASKLRWWEKFGDVYRLGGDEFMVVLTNKPVEYCKSLLDNWYPTVGIINRDSDGFKCALSYGASHGTAGCDFDKIQKEADERMYDFKVTLKISFGEDPNSR